MMGGWVKARVLIGLVALCVAGIAGCGSSSNRDQPTTVRGDADPAAVGVIEKWANELRAGDVVSASERFALPSVVQNGTPALQLTDRRQVEAFNRSLPCGAKLTDAVPSGRFVIATFVLTERPGAGECGNGVGETAKTAFVIHHGLITEWRRVVDIDRGTSTGPVV
jgi:hypothetical protein